MKCKIFLKFVALLCIFCLLCVPVQGAGSGNPNRNGSNGVPGDIDGNGQVNNLDVEMLLWHTLFPEDYPLTVSVDFENDGIVDNKDVEYLLWYTLFPEEYPLADHQHSYTQSVTAPTCTQKGFTTYTCTLCGHSYRSNEVAATGHTWIAATCYVPKFCSVCYITVGGLTTHNFGKWISTGGNQHTRTCPNCHEIQTEYHNWDAGVVTKAATCRAEGIQTFTCTDCGQTRTETIRQLDHIFGPWVLSTNLRHKRTCSVCEISESESHNYLTEIIPPACTTKGYTLHTCDGCLNSFTNNEVKATGHKYEVISIIDRVETKQCANCGNIKTSTLPDHSHAAIDLETMTVSKASSVCAALGNHSLEKYSGMNDVNINVCMKCGFADFASVKSIYTPQEETEILIALAKPVRDEFIYQNLLECGYTEEEALEQLEVDKHVSDRICINDAIRRAKEISVNDSHDGTPINCKELANDRAHNIDEDFQAWRNSSIAYKWIVSWTYPYVGYTRYIIGDTDAETITIYSVAILGYHDR